MIKLKQDCVPFIKASDLPWVKLKHAKLSGFVSSAQKKQLMHDVLANARVKPLVKDALMWPKPVLLRHNDAKHPLHKINLLADFGLDNSNPLIRQIADSIFAAQDEDGAFESLINVPKAFGGNSVDEMSWMLCDYPNLLSALINMGYKDDARVLHAVQHLVNLAEPNGWRCVSALPKMRGPGKKDDHCPYASLLASKCLAHYPTYHTQPVVKNGIDAFFDMWQQQKDKKVRMFGIGTDFRKLKYPNTWYDIVHVLFVLSHFKYAVQNPIFDDMLKIVADKQQPDGSFVPESIFMAYKPYDFGQKKTGSPMLTLKIYSLFINAARFIEA